MSVERARFEREQEMADAIGDATREADHRIDDLESRVQNLTACIRFMTTVDAPHDSRAELRRWAMVYGVDINKTEGVQE